MNTLNRDRNTLKRLVESYGKKANTPLSAV